MQTRYRDLKEAGAELVAISSSAWESHKKLGLSFPVLSDPDGAAIKAYGLLHPHALPMSKLPVARPAELILDESRVVRKRFLTENWRVRERPERLLRELDGL